MNPIFYFFFFFFFVVLPKFEVSVDLPSFLVADAQADDSSHPDLQFNVGAKYTYGQPVVGKAKIIVQIKPYGTLIVLQLTAQNNAMLDLTVPFNDLLKLVPAPSYNYNGWRPINDIRNREILVTAEVTETVTGITLTGNDTMKMANMKYKLMFMDICPVNYKPGLVYTGFLQLSQFDGSAPDARDMVGMTCQVTGNYRYPYDSRFGYREAVRWNDTLEIPSNGLMSFSTLIGDDFSSVTFLVSSRGI
ncbi:hypothetical protein CAPTEDRAFT_208769 [Capitella teleta]|uniref:Macroglobulin domain-containing protein n=1 Tax=Capitella teleta TaxID=283909 RepID=R7TRC4_CAPTE|nr:hypothetical protein CAPTEDRAFT_208769 [Capitella teleta]|eukprot:ELT96127.1 hypothetical protein CAPTEDRAFT_208769 [Capitella teleta]